MPRIFSLFFLSFFILNIADIPFELIQKHSALQQCCCKSGICRCKHMNRGHCPMQRKNISPQAQSKDTGFSPWNCEAEGQKSISPVYSKEFYLEGSSMPFRYAPPQFLFHSFLNNASLLLDQRIDQPPRIF